MRNTIYIVLALASFVIGACNGKKEEQDFGKKQPETSATTAQTPAQKGQEIFEGKGTCTTCHKPNEKVVGPSLQDIATLYKQKGLSVAAFINEESKPVVDPALYETMKANFAITKLMTPEERQNIEAYIMSFAK
ncbi:MAG: c-type cytochrome [Flavobacteriaceae bacterium]